MSRTCERRGERAAWRRSVYSSAPTALFLAGCAALGADAPVEAIPPRADPIVVESPTPAPEALQSSVPDIEETERLHWYAIWLLAGGTPPPDLPAALVKARRDRADIALELVRELLEGPKSGAFREELADLLTLRDIDDVLWCAAARASARLSLYEITNAVAANLESPSAARRVAAREVLFNLRGEWFSTTSEAEASISAGPPPGEAQFAALLATTERLREHAAALYVLDPARAMAALSDPDPQLRVAAARALAEALELPDQLDDFDPVRARSALFERLEEEEHPLVLYVLIGGFLEHLGPADECTSDGREFAGALHARVRGCDSTMLAPLVHGLARMPLDPDPEAPARGDDGVPDVCSLAYAAEALFGDPDGSGESGLLIGWTRSGRLVDVDALASALRSLETFFERLPDNFERLPDNIRRSELRGVLLEAIDDPLRDASIRAGAVRVLARAGRPEDLPRLGAALTEAPTDVAYELIGTITKLVEVVEATNESAIAARDALVAMLSHDEASLRRRALAMLATDPLSALAETTNPKLLLAVLEQDLPTEDSEVLLELLGRRKDPSLVDDLLESDAFERLAAPGSGTASILTETLGSLATGDGPRTHGIARRLIETAGSEGVQRLRNALALVAELPEVAAEALSAEQHADVINWSLDLREVAGTLDGVTPEEAHAAFLERLIDLHLVGCGPESEREQRLAHPGVYLLRADLFVALYHLDSSSAERGLFLSRTLTDFQWAVDHAPSEEDMLLALRDRARFHYEYGDRLHALSDYQRVVRSEKSPSWPADTSVLDLADLRRAGSLTADLTLAGPEPVPTAFAFTWTLIQHDSWALESTGVRLGDLSALVERARTSEADRASLRPLFAGLPVPGADPADMVLPSDAPWLGLETDPEQLMKLRELAAKLDAPLPTPEEPEPDAVDPPEEAETSEEELETASGGDPRSGA